MNLEHLGIPFTDLGPNKEVELLWQISQSLASERSLDEMFQLIVTMTAAVMNSRICSLMILDEENQELKIAATQALSAEYIKKPNLKVGQSISGRAVLEKRPLQVLDVTQEKSYQFPDMAAKQGVVSLLSVPMMIGERVIGVINSYTEEPHKFTDLEVKILEVVANQAAVAIENKMLKNENADMKQAMEIQKIIDQAKKLLMEKDNLSDVEAATLIEKSSKENQKSSSDVASAIILAYSLRK